ncbi:hydrolase, TatD family [Lysobacter dokdonensis DS-58]|uniref:Hydrolase, TatD family n=1 Tax=Lysobacter dokdonensis DS-58 TaxID=1300345 RepID=A0A0A2WJQ7_9GAMM|nr:TatD family hydrolase [Lysobacter dokdonensis]KGQ20411.1 hydrolase, TatD family [Lysobacter dokdonensis DS-58]
MHALVDTHCHLDVSEFDADRDDVVARARAAGVTRQIVPAIEAKTWPGLRDACARDAGLFAAYGLHPLLIAEHREHHLRDLRDWIERERPVAIGECGLDYWIEDLDRDVQATYFDGQLELAREYDLPLVVHARRAVDDVMKAIKRVGKLRGVVHSFAGSEEQARQLADLGFLIGIGGPVTYDRANRVRRVAASVPLDTLLLETDAPDQPDCAHRGQRNEPARMVRVLETIAELRGVDASVVADATTRNAERLFAL